MKKIVINMAPWETRVAITRDNKLENLYFGSSTDKVLERSFFKGKVAKVFPGIQTAFVEIGQEKAGFLHISEVDRELALQSFEDDVDASESKASDGRYKAPDISGIFKEGDEILVQVGKEPVGQKGAKLTTCFTLPGRFLVLMPNIPRICVSKKIEDREERHRLKEVFQHHLPEGMGAIIRTSAEGVDESEIYQDVSFLLNDWKNIQDRFKKVNAPEKIYEDMDISLQVVRDHLDDDVEMIVTDNLRNQEQMYLYIKSVAPEHQFKVQHYDGQTNVFEHFGLEKQITDALYKKVNLKSGGSIIIESTEAMTVIDVNTGRYIGKKNLEETMLTTNLEAASAIVRQLKLRNIGGLIVIDFIDMSETSNKQKLVESFEHELKLSDKFQSVVLSVSAFGLVQMTRKRSGKTLQQKLSTLCDTCKGSGMILSVRTQSYDILYKAQRELKQKQVKKVVFTVNPQVFDFISSIEYNSILVLEKEIGSSITFNSDASYKIDQYTIKEKK